MSKWASGAWRLERGFPEDSLHSIVASKSILLFYQGGSASVALTERTEGGHLGLPSPEWKESRGRLGEVEVRVNI